MVFKNEEERDSSELRGKRGGYGYTARISAQGLRARAVRAEGRSASRLANNADGEPRSAVHRTSAEAAEMMMSMAALRRC